MIKQNLSYSGRPVEETHLEIAATFKASGIRPIEKSPEFLLPEHLTTDSKSINQHPLVETHLKIAATFEASGTRPIEKSPEFLLPEYLTTDSEIINRHPLVEIRRVSSSEKIAS